ncbi:hypothetical protein B834_842 [Enterococcus mundtii 1A]|nr:hypothetical protein [Enterococcus mundtii 1A]
MFKKQHFGHKAKKSKMKQPFLIFLPYALVLIASFTTSFNLIF